MTADIGGSINSTNGGQNSIMLNSSEAHLTTGGIYSNNSENSTTLDGRYRIEDTTCYLTINGDIQGYNNGQNFIGLFGASQLEVNGDVISQNGGAGAPYDLSSNLFQTSEHNDSLTFLGGFTADGGENRITTNAGDDDVYIEGDLNATNGRAEGGGINLFDLGAGNDMLTLIGNVTASNGGKNTINGGAGDDTIHLNGHVDAGALSIMGGEGNDTLILTAATQSRFEADHKEWLLDLSSSGSLADSGIETIRLDVRNVQTAKLGWLTDLIDQANADGAHITLEDKNGNVIVEPQLYLSQDNPSAAIDPITALLDQHAPVAEEAAQSKAFALTAAQHAPEHNFAFDIANNNFIQDLEQHAQAAVVA